MEQTLNTEELSRVIFIEELSKLIGKKETTIRTCATNRKYAHLIPRPFKLPNSRRLAWMHQNVMAWIGQSTPVSPASTKHHIGAPTKTERAAAQAAGLSVKEWRRQKVLR